MIRYSILPILYFLFATTAFAIERDSTMRRWNYGLELNIVLVPKPLKAIDILLSSKNNIGLGLRYHIKYSLHKNWKLTSSFGFYNEFQNYTTHYNGQIKESYTFINFFPLYIQYENNIKKLKYYMNLGVNRNVLVYINSKTTYRTEIKVPFDVWKPFLDVTDKEYNKYFFTISGGFFIPNKRGHKNHFLGISYLKGGGHGYQLRYINNGTYFSLNYGIHL